MFNKELSLTCEEKFQPGLFGLQELFPAACARCSLTALFPVGAMIH